jgi:L-lactate dehydrogenase complex protein LldG
VRGAREEILSRIGAALRDVPADERPAEVAVAREYRRRADLGPTELAERLARRLRDYHAGVRRVVPAGIAAAVAEACEEMKLRRIVVPESLPSEWRPEGVEVVEDEGLTAEQLDAIDGALTGCAAAIAETGTLVLDGRGASGRRAITLVPDHLICVVRMEQVVGLVPEAIAALERPVGEQSVPVTLISGPSASSDIELSRVEGVHGPRHLRVVIAGLGDPVQSS